jgi:hypothetical protein
MFIEKSTIVLTDGNSLKYNLSVRIYLLIFALDTHYVKMEGYGKSYYHLLRPQLL